MKDQVVVFTKNNARVLVGIPPRIANKRAKLLVNPDLSRVKNIPTHFWKLDNGRVVEMTPREKAWRMLNIKVNGVDNDYKSVLSIPVKNYWNYLWIGLIIMASAIISHILTKVFSG